MSDLHPPSRRELDSHSTPAFCAGCRKPFPEGQGLAICPACGDRLIPQGYCPVCEAHWQLAVGEPCPKHDLPLDAERPPRFEFADLGADVRWVTVCHFEPTRWPPRPREFGWKPRGYQPLWTTSEWGPARCTTWPPEACGCESRSHWLPRPGSSFPKPGRPLPPTSISKLMMTTKSPRRKRPRAHRRHPLVAPLSHGSVCRRNSGIGPGLSAARHWPDR